MTQTLDPRPATSESVHGHDPTAFLALDEDQMAALAAEAEECRFAPGEALISAGDTHYPFYVVRSGRVAIYDETGDERRTLVEHGPGGFVGDIDLMTGRPCLIAAEAAEPTTTICIRSDRLLAVLGDLPWLAGTLFEAFTKRRELLERSGFVGTRLVARTRDADALRIREFFYKNNVPSTFYDCDEEDGRALLDRNGLTAEATPVILCRGHVVSPSVPVEDRRVPGHPAEGAQGGHRPPDRRGRAGGLAAAIYAGSEGLATLVLDRVGPGGQAGSSSRIENYMGFVAGLSGRELAGRGYLQALKCGVKFTAPAEAESITDDEGGGYRVRLCTGEDVRTRTVLVASGVRYRQLGIPGCERYENAGLYYAATSVESRLCQETTAIVVGAGNSAGQAAMYLSQSAKRVLVVVRGDDVRKSMSSYLADRLEHTPNIEIRLATQVTSVVGDDALRSVELTHTPTGAAETVDCAAVFIFVGAEPHTGWLAGQVALDEKGFILCGPDLDRGTQWPLDRDPCPLESSRPGLFAAGDVRSRTTKRVAFAVGDGALAVTCVHQYLSQMY